MKQCVFDIKEMSDSKEIYGRRPNPIVPIFIYTILGLLVCALVYCSVGKIEMVATSSGMIRPNENVATVSSLRGGVIKEVNYYNGQQVSAGDVLVVMDTKELELQLDNLNSTVEDYKYQIEMIGKFIGGIEKGENPFSSDANGKEFSYYIQFQEYLLQLKNSSSSLSYDAQQNQGNIDRLVRQIEDLETQLEGWKSYKTSIAHGKNFSKDYPEYENMYRLYAAAMEALKNDYEAQREQVKSSVPEDQQKDKLAELEASYETAKEQKYYQAVIQIDTSIQSLQGEITAAKASLEQYRSAKEQYGNNLDGEALSISSMRVGKLSSLLNQRRSIQAQLEEVKVQTVQLGEQISQGKITAQRSGTVSCVQTLVSGDILSAGTTIAAIIPSNENACKVQLYVHNGDIAKIQAGDRVRYNVAALPSSQYGAASGTVTNISADTMLQDGQYSGYYLVECTIDQTKVMDDDGNVASISTGMQVEGKIITQEKTILRYLLEKIDIF